MISMRACSAKSSVLPWERKDSNATPVGQPPGNLAAHCAPLVPSRVVGNAPWHAVSHLVVEHQALAPKAHRWR